MTRIPMNYKVNIAAGLRTPTGHLSVSARGSDKEAENLKNLGAQGNSIADLQKDYFETLGQDGTLDDLFGEMSPAQINPDYKVTYRYKENYDVGSIPNLKDLFPINICNIEFTNPLVLESATTIRLQDRDIVDIPELLDYPEISNQSFYVKKVGKNKIALYKDIYFNIAIDGTTFANQTYAGVCSLTPEAAPITTPEPINGTFRLKRVLDKNLDPLTGNVIKIDGDWVIIDTTPIDVGGRKLRYRGTFTGPVAPTQPFDPLQAPNPIILDGISVDPIQIFEPITIEDPAVGFDPIVKKGTDTNPLPEGVSINLIIPNQVDEGQLFNIDLQTTGFAEGTEFPFVISGDNITAGDYEIGTATGSFTIDANGNATLPYKFLADLTTEGLEIASISLVGYPIEGAININDASTTPPPSVTVTPVLTPVAESGAVEFDISVVSYPVGTIFDYTLYGDVDAGDFADGQLAGSFTYNGVSPVRVTHALSEDYTTEGDENCYLTITGMETDPNATGLVVISDTSTNPTYALNANVTTTDESTQNIVFTLTTTNVPDGNVYSYAVTGIDAADVTGDPLVGQMTVQNNTATVTFTTVADETTEGDEVLTFILSSLGLSANVTIVDSSQDPVLVAADVQLLFTADTWDGTTNNFPNRLITEYSQYARPIFAHNGITKGVDSHGPYFTLPYQRAIWWADGSGDYSHTDAVSELSTRIGPLTDFQMHMVYRPTQSTVSSDHPWMIWGLRDNASGTYFGERFRSNTGGSDVWVDGTLKGAVTTDSYNTQLNNVITVSVIWDASNGGDYVVYKNGVEVGRTNKPQGLYNNNFIEVIFSEKYANTTRSDGLLMDLFYVELKESNDFTYFTNQHNLLRTDWGSL